MKRLPPFRLRNLIRADSGDSSIRLVMIWAMLHVPVYFALCWFKPYFAAGGFGAAFFAMVAAVAGAKAYQNQSEYPGAAADVPHGTEEAAKLINSALAGELVPESRSERMIATLIPAAQEHARNFLNELREALPASATAEIISGNRTPQEQAALYAQGRTTPGKIVTYAGPWQSNHNFGIAWDVGIFTQGRYLEDSSLYEFVGSVAKAQGLTWGGEWSGKKQDPPHVEWRPDWAKDLSESAMLAELRRRHDAGEAIA